MQWIDHTVVSEVGEGSTRGGASKTLTWICSNFLPAFAFVFRLTIVFLLNLGLVKHWFGLDKPEHDTKQKPK